MNPAAVIERLRRDEVVRTLPDGTEVVPVSIQHQEPLASMPRAERKQWLSERFAQLYGGDVRLQTESVSPSGQTVEALCPIAELSKLMEKTAANSDRVDIVRSRNAEL